MYFKSSGGHHLSDICTWNCYKLVQYFQQFYTNIDLDEYIDLAALGTVADVALLQDENRALVQQGLRVLSQRRNLGIKALLEVANCQKTYLSVRDAGFLISPRLNASGRLSSAEYGVQLLLVLYKSEANMYKRLEDLNQERRQL